jgi:endogenous inhibitor of DNA gyrase (YacG/DUF329 family)
MPFHNPIKVYDAWNSIEAHLVHNLLVDEGIAARIESDGIDALGGKVPYQKVTCPIWVSGGDAPRARAVVAAYVRQRQQPPACQQAAEETPESFAAPFCYHCGQPLDAEQTTCPECGEPLDWSR